ncbi:cation diffusion facilitator family transporter [Pseudokordiimonas caeni]|uniref:cation diffusion facilitator family transporter n=1 Tax=Pseudokordiimonas caeni TaxID=2997908 RepID=UPI002811A662|nr:cation diffusion facilitator family transporter [Pseudokordiimonas caeni]
MTRAAQDRLMILATFASMGVATTLVVTKTLVWWASGSVAMLGSMADSALDLLASAITFLAVRMAVMPPDEDHRFGHGKAEAIAGLIQSGIIMASSFFILMESSARLYNPMPVQATGPVIAVSVLSIVLSLGLVLFQRFVVARTRSIAVAGDHLHYQGDLLMNAAVIAAVLIAGTGFTEADGIFGILIALYIGHGAYGIGRNAIDMLMDREFSDADRETIFNLVMGNPDVRGLHELKTRHAGRDSFIQLHIEVDGEMTVREGHLVGDEIEATLSEAFPNAEILIHIDPPSEYSGQLTAAEVPMPKEET